LLIPPFIVFIRWENFLKLFGFDLSVLWRKFYFPLIL